MSEPKSGSMDGGKSGIQRYLEGKITDNQWSSDSKITFECIEYNTCIFKDIWGVRSVIRGIKEDRRKYKGQVKEHV